MSQVQNEGPRIGEFTIDAACAPFLRLKHSATAGVLSIAGDEACIGTADIRAYANGDPMTLYDLKAPGTRCFVCSAAITAGDNVSSSTLGRVTTGTGGAQYLGKALTTTANAGEQVTVLLAASLAGTTSRASIAQQDLQPYPILMESWYLFDSTIHAPLGATALSADDLIYTLGTIGTSEPKLTATDFGGSTATQKVRIRLALPVEYVAGETITLRVTGLTGTTIADASSTVDFNVYRATAPTVDICATVAQSINSLTAVDVDFTLTPTNCVPGDVLDILLTYSGTDSGNLGVIAPAITSVVLLLDIKG